MILTKFRLRKLLHYVDFYYNNDFALSSFFMKIKRWVIIFSASSVVSSHGPTSATREHEKRILESILPPDLRHLVRGGSPATIQVAIIIKSTFCRVWPIWLLYVRFFIQYVVSGFERPLDLGRVAHGF
jgi:hypothetical protein